MSDSAHRSRELDALRGFAVLGIFWVNIVYLGWPFDARLYPTLFGGPRLLNELSWGFIHLLVEGAMFALFSMLFGASAFLMLDEKRLDGPGGLRTVDGYYRRNLWLIGFGALHAFVLLWPLEILFTYGVLGLALFPLRRLKAHTLLAAGVLMLGWGNSPPLHTLLSSPEPQAVETSPAQVARAYPLSDAQLVQALGDEIESISADMALYHADYATIFFGNIDVAVGQQSTNFYEDNLWDAGGMMLVGMALFKWGVLTGGRSLGFYALLTGLGFAAAILLRLPAVSAGIVSGFDPDVVQRVSSVPNILGRLPLALGYVGLLMLLCRWRALLGLTQALAAAGRLAFTHYVAQTLFSLGLFYEFGFGLFGKLPYYQMILVAVGFGAFQVWFSIYWLRRFHQGPLEWLWRCLVQRKRLPLRKAAAVTVAAPPTAAVDPGA